MYFNSLETKKKKKENEQKRKWNETSRRRHMFLNNKWASFTASTHIRTHRVNRNRHDSGYDAHAAAEFYAVFVGLLAVSILADGVTNCTTDTDCDGYVY